jgi:microcystin-dependent protein
MAYDFDPLKPLGTQPGYDLDDAIRDTRAGAIAMMGTEHSPDVSDPTAVTAVHKAGFCTAAYLAANAVETAKIKDANVTAAKLAANAAVPAGFVWPYAGSTAPTGWLECNGAAVNRTTYAALFTAIGTTFGVGNGSTTFNLPDLRGEFIRGWDHGKGVDTGRALGSAQTDEFKSHTHGVPRNANQLAGGGNGYEVEPSAGYIQTAAAGGSETRPRNVALMYCIKH